MRQKFWPIKIKKEKKKGRKVDEKREKFAKALENTLASKNKNLAKRK